MRRTIYTDEHTQFRQAVRGWLGGEVVPRMAEFTRQRLIARDVWLSAGKQGLLSIEIPAQYGGTNARDYRVNSVLMEELARVSLGLASSLSIHYDIVAPYLTQYATEAAKAEYLPRFVTGEMVGAVAMTEPSGGSDLARLRTSALPDGSDWRLTGSKTFITNGSSADLIVVAARTGDSGAKCLSLFLVDAESPGFARGRKLDKVGQPESDTAELFFDDVRVPAERVLGEVGQGFAYMMRNLPQERIGTAVCNLAHARTAFEETLIYARERSAFGQPIGTFQHNAFRLAELATELDVAQAFVDAAIAAHAGHELSTVDAAKAKWWVAELQNRVLDQCVQLFGGYGYMREYPIAQAWMDARVTRIWAGADEIMKQIIGKDLGF